MNDSPEPQLTERERAVLRYSVQHGASTFRALMREHPSFSYWTAFNTVSRLRVRELLRIPPKREGYGGSISRSIVATEQGRVALHTRVGFPPRSEWPLASVCVDGYYDGLGNQVFEL